MTRPGAFGAALVFVVASSALLSAQSRFELGAGISLTGGFDAGGQNAELTRNPATGSSPLALFEASSRVNAAPGASLAIGFDVTKRFAVEAVGEYSRPILRSTISSDFEGATGTTAESRLTSVLFGGSVLYRLGSSRLTTFVYGGAGWLRQLDEENVMLVSGPELHGGGGVKYRLDRHFALRAQGGVSVREKSIAFDEKRRLQPQVSGGLAFRW